ncbi:MULTISPECIES: hypothetical protein [Burkholderia]|uniref:hypothetical protein n=1 Tax=Burkholderia TaxID=32008 RepID=UPI00117757AC|nr:MULTISPECIES: hypothetical protein [Burkholderia]MCA8107006.1 hypothetical protein [Burkholderia sp. AU36459]MDF3099158.1 hypothetical protein [Burkholderia semiarida]MDF3117642.1 hypothetical protein [Burkholderia semiarida]
MRSNTDFKIGDLAIAFAWLRVIPFGLLPTAPHLERRHPTPIGAARSCALRDRSRRIGGPPRRSARPATVDRRPDVIFGAQATGDAGRLIAGAPLGSRRLPPADLGPSSPIHRHPPRRADAIRTGVPLVRCSPHFDICARATMAMPRAWRPAGNPIPAGRRARWSSKTTSHEDIPCNSNPIRRAARFTKPANSRN